MPKVDRNKERTGTELAKWVKLKSSEKEEELYDFKGPVEEIEVTQESRQKGFDNYETTDDHGMVIIGKAEDQKGNKYYKVKTRGIQTKFTKAISMFLRHISCRRQ